MAENWRDQIAEDAANGFQLILTMDPAPPADGARILLHCTGHEPPLLLGTWLAPDDEESEAAYMAGVTAAVEAHRPEHAKAAG